MAGNLQAIYKYVVEGKKEKVKSAVQQALNEEIPAEEILKRGLIEAMEEVGERFEQGTYFVPEMLISARAMKVGLTLLKPRFVGENIQTLARAVIGTIKGDLHDIGKNLVALMLEGAGFEIIDLGKDVSPKKFVSVVQEEEAELVCISALLTTTMQNMKMVIKELEDKNVRNDVKVLVGGAPVTESFAKNIGADGYAPNARRAVLVAKSFIN